MSVKSMLFVLPVTVASEEEKVLALNFVFVFEASWDLREYMQGRIPPPGHGFVSAAYLVPDPKTVGVFQVSSDLQLGPYEEDVYEAVNDRLVHVYVEPEAVSLLSSKKQQLRGMGRPYLNFSYDGWSLVVPNIGESVALGWDHFEAVRPVGGAVPPASAGV